MIWQKSSNILLKGTAMQNKDYQIIDQNQTKELAKFLSKVTKFRRAHIQSHLLFVRASLWQSVLCPWQTLFYNPIGTNK